ncbi:MAG: YihY/virulence factor BrkB family protein [Silvibacterium sp.]|nr:YihY/virulence factor BrkB family protein [Silvibacterium sp.]MBV8438410.1 YihY/virulence factor BrkB family protein [Silvibacterium sp.]
MNPLIIFDHLRRALWRSFGHSALNNAKAAAYSAILSIFPALLVVTTLLALTPETDTVRSDIRNAFSEFLPPDTMSLLQTYFLNNHAHSVRLIWTAICICLGAAMGVMLSLMDGFRQAYLFPRREWSFWREHLIALMLVPGTLVPLIFATGLVAFGHAIEHWMIENADHEIRLYVLFIWRMIRWTIATLTSIAMLVVIYHFGTPRARPWKQVLPGSLLATVTWFLTTLGYGWYITRYADYSVVYGSFAAGVATLVWLYMICFTILVGAEFNALIFPAALPAASPIAEFKEDKNVVTMPPQQAV